MSTTQPVAVATTSSTPSTASTVGTVFATIFIILAIIVLIVAIYNIWQVFKIGDCDVSGMKVPIGFTIKLGAIFFLLMALGLVGASIYSIMKAREAFTPVGKNKQKYYH